ncbi:HugZ family protein [Mycobacterium sp.]|uniref:HugZ family pyridoxamine 5'-phosphate oxidase n=1 Tax=Mycobacterium sp. TaxID=1785 RepID=UPI003D10B233
MVIRDHGDVGDAPSVPPPLQPVSIAAQPSAAEQARTIAAGANAATLATLTADGDPWASLVAYGLMGGAPVLCVSNLAEHGRNLANDPRASVSIVAASSDVDPLATARITLAGVVVSPVGADRDAARAAYLEAVPGARFYIEYSDFTLWVLGVDRVRWVGGYGRMDSATGANYLAAESDPVTPAAARAIAHLNADHADALVSMARAFGGYPDTETAVCTGIDRYGLDLRVHTLRGVAYTRVGFPDALHSAAQLRSATADLTDAANAAR